MRMKNTTRGFTLIEMIVVIFILSIGLISVAALFVAGTVSSSKARRNSTASYAAQKQMERLHSAGYSGCIVDPDVFTTADGYTIIQQNSDKTGQVGFSVPELPNGQGVIDIQFYDSGSGYYPNLKDIAVTVTWTGGKPTAGRSVLRTLIANRP